jgi:hypothetical protein
MEQMWSAYHVQHIIQSVAEKKEKDEALLLLNEICCGRERQTK